MSAAHRIGLSSALVEASSKGRWTLRLSLNETIPKEWYKHKTIPVEFFREEWRERFLHYANRKNSADYEWWGDVELNGNDIVVNDIAFRDAGIGYLYDRLIYAITEADRRERLREEIRRSEQLDGAPQPKAPRASSDKEYAKGLTGYLRALG